jgi:hypothetical protein
MGDEDKLTPEEMAIVGDEQPEPQAADQGTPQADSGSVASTGGAPAPGTQTKTVKRPQEPEQHTDSEKKAMEAMGLRIEKGFIIDDDGTKIPAQRWKKLYHNYKEAERKHSEAATGRTELEKKFKLFRILGPDKYYDIYQDERPKDYHPKQGGAPGQAATKQTDPFSLVAQYPDPNHPFHGMTLGDIYKQDPAEGRRLERAWEQNQQKQTTAEQQRKEAATQSRRKLLQESEKEVKDFSESLAKDLFRKDVSSLSKEEEEKVDQTIRQTLEFMKQTRRGGGNLADAYYIMNRETLLKDAKATGGRAALESLQKNHVPSIGAGAGAAPAGMDALESMSSDQLARHIEGMSEKAYMAFLKNASPELKAKHPSIAWD